MLLADTGNAATQIYRIVDEQGNVTFTDRPPRENDQATTEVGLDELNTFEVEDVIGKGDEIWMSNLGANDPDQVVTQEVAYTIAQILTPANDETIRENAGNMQITTRIVPQLQPGHSLQLVFDGSPHQAKPANSTFTLTNVDRGTHQIAVRVVDSAGEVKFSGASSTFHMMRAIATPRATPH
ncbi:MAG: DUF4124 domain-containing protein [Proteobacteria bacterium]|nr:DUF4124 domain-containing protein [Pseudomonadota bacterium]